MKPGGKREKGFACACISYKRYYFYQGIYKRIYGALLLQVSRRYPHQLLCPFHNFQPVFPCQFIQAVFRQQIALGKDSVGTIAICKYLAVLLEQRGLIILIVLDWNPQRFGLYSYRRIFRNQYYGKCIPIFISGLLFCDSQSGFYDLVVFCSIVKEFW